jgi:RNA polymerase sigma-70 factor (family 1)
VIAVSVKENNPLRVAAEEEEEVFAALFRAYYDELYSTALMYIKIREMAEDIVQQVFLRVWEKREALVTVGNLKGYLFIAVRNEIMSYLRHQAIQKKYIDQVKALFVESLVTPEQQFIDKQNAEIFQQAVKNLPSQQRQVWRLSRESGLSYKEIACQMDIALPTVKDYLSNALRSIRAFLILYRNDIVLTIIVFFFR